MPLPAPSSAAATDAVRDALPAGTLRAEFRLLRVLGRGGFGIVYLAHDESLDRAVAIKEFLPALWAVREVDGRVTARCPSFAGAYAAGLRSFVDEARMLARFDHPSLVKVHRFWEERGTAYMVMPYCAGISLRQLRASMSEPPTEAWLRRLLDGLLGALQVLHDASVLHRDVAPDNILMTPGGVPMLLDFGAARRVRHDRDRALTAILKPSFAPIEQYAADAQASQGPWTDLYGVAATLAFALTGVVPCTAAARVLRDTQPRLQDGVPFGPTDGSRAHDRGWLAALDWGLAVLPKDRPQSIAQWRLALAGGAAPRTDGQHTRQPTPHTLPRAPIPVRPWAGALVAAMALLGVGPPPAGGGPATHLAVAETPSPTPTPTPTPTPMPMPMPTAAPALAPTRESGPVPARASRVTLAADAPSRPRSPPTTPRASKARARSPLPGPEERCAAVNWFGRANCMRTLCEASAWRRHPQCSDDGRGDRFLVSR